MCRGDAYNLWETRWPELEVPGDSRLNSWPRKMAYYYIQNVDTGLVLDINNEIDAASTPVIMYAYKGSPNQLWTFKDNIFRSQLNGMVLDVSPAGHLNIYPYNGGSNQRWYIEGAFIRSGNGKYMDVAQQNRRAGAKVITYKLNRGENQKFRVVPA